ncbi:sensor histidine kinase [Nocardioides ganghwensis]|jgi:signal transduction histidine kinase|uniref:histidine kinase n=1 Tax=Nocardioides ganghwensis TaxID=252230 RepID=A0A4Q2SE35_9ACTN|nr:sensor histidine kinase [Nocardioides ganghwensis]MBD3945714.1 sensor histidine kinase [Nocardioides ganghwensis]RYC01119.1 sensor histidine kinase [Nocardioides ganghwensis]
MPSTSQRALTWFGVDDDWERPRPPVGRQDVVLAASVEAVSLLALELVRSAGGLDHTDAPVWSQWLAVSTGAALLLGRRRWPLLVASLAALHMFVVGVTMPQVMGQVSLQIVYFVALLSGVAWARDRRAMVVVIGTIVLVMFAWITWQFAVGSAAQDMIDAMDAGDRVGFFPPIPSAVAMTLLVNVIYFGGAIVGGGVSWRAARQRLRLQEQATTIAAQAGRLREQAVVDERLRIARELHDVVAHGVSAMGIQAGAARRVLDRDPDAARTALSHVEDASRDAVTQMRRLLGTLREGPGDGTGDGTGTRTTDAAIGDLPALVAAAREHGLAVHLDVVEAQPDAADRLPRGIGLAVYRTVQEALTNVRRHSTADTVSVVVRVDEAAAYAEVEVVDNGRPRHGTSGSGLGQLGIRERAATHDGQVDIGPRVTGGYRVRVRYPLGVS